MRGSLAWTTSNILKIIKCSSWLFFFLLLRSYSTRIWGAEKRTAIVVTIVNVVKIIKQNLKMEEFFVRFLFSLTKYLMGRMRQNEAEWLQQLISKSMKGFFSQTAFMCWMRLKYKVGSTSWYLECSNIHYETL